MIWKRNDSAGSEYSWMCTVLGLQSEIDLQWVYFFGVFCNQETPLVIGLMQIYEPILPVADTTELWIRSGSFWHLQ